MGKKVVVLTETQLKKVINRVINEQTAPTNTQQQTKDPQQLLGDQMINAVKSKQYYIASPLFPKKIITNINLDQGDGRNGGINFQVYALTDPKTLTQGLGHSLDLNAIRPEGVSATGVQYNSQTAMRDDNIIDLYSKGVVKVVPNSLKRETDPMANTIPVDIADVMIICGGDKNPKVFLDFLKQLEPNSETWLQQALVRKANGQLNQVVDKQAAQKLLQVLFPQQPQAQPQQAQPTK